MAPTTPPRDGRTPAELGRTLLDLYRETVARSPDRLAIDCDDGQLTHIELFDAVRALAGRLQRRGIGPGDWVGIDIADGTVDLYVAVLGVLLAGGGYVRVDRGAAPARPDVIREAADLTAVVEPELAVREVHAPVGERRPVHADDPAWLTLGAGAPGGRVVTHRRALILIADGNGGSDVGDAGEDGASLGMWLAWAAGDVIVTAPRVQSIAPE